MKTTNTEIITATREAILDYLRENEDTAREIIEELDSWNGYLGDDRYYSMDELPELMSNTNPITLLNMAYFGHDEDDGHGSSFNPNRDYFRFNGYGNLVSTNYPDYSDHIDRYLLDELRENRDRIDAIDEDDTLCELFDRLDDLEADEDEADNEPAA